jgi:uncharacterized protein YutD
MIDKRFILIFLLFIAAGTVASQELRCNVQVISSQVQGTNKEVFRTLQEAVYEFMNNRIWTEDQFAPQERIECKVLLNIKDHSGDEFTGSMQVSSRRPVYNSSYSTTLLQYKDDNLAFRYIENEPLEFDINTYESNLTSILAYYAYIILGYDYDSFSLKGGTPYFEKAQQIVSQAQNSKYKGWKAYEDRRNRYWLVENILDNEYSPIREFTYRYHRKGMDLMYDKTPQAKAEIIETFELLQDVFREKPDPYLFYMNLMLEAKSDEFINIFSEGEGNQPDRVYEILSEIDPSRSDRYKKITEN